MTDCQIHNVRFYNLEPKMISCLAYCKQNSKLALTRQDASIEIWDLSYAPHLEKTIQGTADGSIEAIAWSRGRLLSTGLGGFLVQWDLQLLKPKRTLAVTGNAAWCLDVNRTNTQIVIGTEQGYLNLFTISNDDIIYDKILDKQEGRILCCKFNTTGEYIVTGSVDIIRIWNSKSGHAIHKMTTGRSESNKETIVWCLAVTEDFTIISGDSRGIITFWDGNLGAQIESLETHKADILTMCLSDDQQSFYCAGVDPNISHFARIKVKKGESGYVYKWVRSVHRKIHDHDVRALTLCEGKVVSGGVDCYLNISSYPPKTLHKYPPLLQKPCVTVCTESRLLLLRHHSHMVVWKLGEAKQNQPQTARTIPLETSPQKLLLMYSKGREHIVCCSLSQNGKWLAYSTDTAFRIFKFILNDNDMCTIERMGFYIPEFVYATRIEFTKDNSFIIVVTRKMTLEVAMLTKDEVSHVQTIDLSSVFSDLVHILNVSENYLVLAALCGGVATYTQSSDGHYIPHRVLPRYHCPVTALGLSPFDHLVAVYSDHKMIEYDLNNQQFTEFSQFLSSRHPRDWLNRSTIIEHVTFDPLKKEIILLHDDTMICVIDKVKAFKQMAEDNSKLMKLDQNGSNGDSSQTKPQFKIIKKYKHLVHLGWLAEKEMVAVEINPLTLTEQLPPPIYEKKFGCM